VVNPLVKISWRVNFLTPCLEGVKCFRKSLVREEMRDVNACKHLLNGPDDVVLRIFSPVHVTVLNFL